MNDNGKRTPEGLTENQMFLWNAITSINIIADTHEGHWLSTTTPSVRGAIATQIALESGWGKSGLSEKHKNYSGIKAFKSWKGRTTDNDYPHVYRSYDTFEGYLLDYVQVLHNGFYPKSLIATTADEFFDGLNPNWAEDKNYQTKLESIYDAKTRYIVETYFTESEIVEPVPALEEPVNDIPQNAGALTLSQEMHTNLAKLYRELAEAHERYAKSIEDSK